MKPEEARKILGLGSLALDRQRLQRAFHRRLFEIHPDTRKALVGPNIAGGAASEEKTENPVRAWGKMHSSSGPSTVGANTEPADVSVDMLIEARKVLLLSLERSPPVPEQKFRDESRTEQSSGTTATTGQGQPGQPGRRNAGFSSMAAAGPEGYNLYRRALFLYSEAIIEYFERRKGFQGNTVSEPEAEPEAFRERLEEARSLFVLVLELFPGGTWTPDSIEQIARINVWLKRYRAGGGQVSE
ncbi:MAG: hypothetical protein KDK23_11865 [Leptospiraceae bacterium]|nr:hypothetical protein [Leptospiraceae bacterium]